MYRGSWTSVVWDELCTHRPSVAWWNPSTSHNRIVHGLLPSAGPSTQQQPVLLYTKSASSRPAHAGKPSDCTSELHQLALITAREESEAQKYLAFFHWDCLKYHQISLDLKTLIKKTGLCWDFDATCYSLHAFCCSLLVKLSTDTEDTALRTRIQSTHVLDRKKKHAADLHMYFCNYWDQQPTAYTWKMKKHHTNDNKTMQTQCPAARKLDFKALFRP